MQLLLLTTLFSICSNFTPVVLVDGQTFKGFKGYFKHLSLPRLQPFPVLMLFHWLHIPSELWKRKPNFSHISISPQTERIPQRTLHRVQIWNSWVTQTQKYLAVVFCYKVPLCYVLNLPLFAIWESIIFKGLLKKPESLQEKHCGLETSVVNYKLFRHRGIPGRDLLALSGWVGEESWYRDWTF